MSFSRSNCVLLRGMLAGAVVLTGTACSRSDRTESARDNSAAVLPDTSNVAQDTSSNVARPSGGGTATGAMSDEDTAGYRSMERDTTNIPSQGPDSAGGTADTANASSSLAPSDSVSAGMSASSTDSASAAVSGTNSTEVSADTSAAGYAEMARDTSTVVDQADTAATPGEVAVAATIDTSAQAGDTSSQTNGTDSTAGAPSPDSIEVARVRPPEDSTEILGNVTTADEAANETADEVVVRPEDRETVAASETPTDEVGAAAVGGNVTGAEAAALMSREGVRCAIVDPEANEAVRWDMSSSPITLNPCGMGSMVLSRIGVER